MAANLFRRYIWLADTIYSAGHITLEEINRKWSMCSLNENHASRITRRTFIYWRHEVEELFGLFIECDKSTNTYYIANAEDLTTSKTQRWLLNTFAVTNLVQEFAPLQDHVLLEDMPSDARYLAPIMEAIREGRVIKLTYQRFDAPAPHDFTMEAYCLKVFKQRWYVAGRSSDHPNEVRVYALDRVHGIKVLDEHYTIPKDFDGKTFFSDYYGVFVGGTQPEKVVIKANSANANYIRSLPLHKSQKETVRNMEHSIFEYFVAPTFDFIQELRTHGAGLEVLEPAWLVKNFVDFTNDMNKIYKK
ncbi:MAG: WYL domain-containing protein [Paludibacteraceae bacterium]|nr:WYL domain-containing protein [Paludibacteraceae bacterium]